MRNKKMMKSREKSPRSEINEGDQTRGCTKEYKQRRGLTEEKAAVREESDWLISNHYDCDD